MGQMHPNQTGGTPSYVDMLTFLQGTHGLKPTVVSCRSKPAQQGLRRSFL